MTLFTVTEYSKSFILILIHFSPSFLFLQVTKDELSRIVQGFEKIELLTSGGVTLAGSRFIYLSGNEKVIRAKLGKVGVHCVKTNQGNALEIFLIFITYKSSVNFLSSYCVS